MRRSFKYALAAWLVLAGLLTLTGCAGPVVTRHFTPYVWEDQQRENVCYVFDTGVACLPMVIEWDGPTQ